LEEFLRFFDRWEVTDSRNVGEKGGVGHPLTPSRTFGNEASVLLTGVEQPFISPDDSTPSIRDDAQNDAFSSVSPSPALSLLLKLTVGLAPEERALLGQLLGQGEGGSTK
jgi:hypothetical protein